MCQWRPLQHLRSPLMMCHSCSACRKSDQRWRPVLQAKVPYAKTAELRRYVSPIFEELNWAYSSAPS